jgi:hypothetical protein
MTAPVWIPTKDALPELDEAVVVKVVTPGDDRTGTAVSFAYRCTFHNRWHNLDGDDLMEPSYISHWSPMPVDSAPTAH